MSKERAAMFCPGSGVDLRECQYIFLQLDESTDPATTFFFWFPLSVFSPKDELIEEQFESWKVDRGSKRLFSSTKMKSCAEYVP
jgi:hypothetical protein